MEEAGGQARRVVLSRPSTGLHWVWRKIDQSGSWLLIHNFDGADSTTTVGSASTGQAPVTFNGAWGIKGGKAYPVSGADNSYLSFDIGTATHYAEYVLPTFGAGLYPGVMARCDASNRYHYRVEALETSGQIALSRNNAAASNTGLWYSSTGLVTAGTRIGLDVADVVDAGVTKTRVRLYLNDALLTTYLDDTTGRLTTGNSVGFRHGVAGTNPNCFYDGLRAKAL